MTTPLLTLRLHFLFSWEQTRPGGCRCVCRLFHNIPGTGVCLAAAEPGLLLRVETATETGGPWPVCRDCYTMLAPLAEPRP
ncbi:DUF6372 family protein [Streptomyces sp. NPDC053253]|uniref:DUF6372 family protein n=1 Tax=Streptomyces sp. NPDC053253 TaxID=3365699 RepID=UPI0037D3ECF0